MAENAPREVTPHAFEHGRLAYVQIPAVDCRRSSQFYASVFDWKIRGGGSDHVSFSDSTGGTIATLRDPAGNTVGVWQRGNR